MKKNNLVFLGHMLDQARLASRKAAGLTREEFDRDENLRLAITLLLQTIGEAARRIDREFQDQHAGIPWREIIGMRHRLIHDYMYVDYDIVWNTATLKLPQLISQLEAILPS